MDILENKKYIEYGRLSRYSSVPVYFNTEDEKWVMGTTNPLSKDIEHSVYTVVSGESYDLIALKAYNNPTYYWVICDFNNIPDPLIPPAIGTELKIPILSKLTFES